MALVQGDYEAIRRFGEASLLVYRRVGDDHEVVLMLGVRSFSFLATGDVAQGYELAEGRTRDRAAIG